MVEASGKPDEAAVDPQVEETEGAETEGEGKGKTEEADTASPEAAAKSKESRKRRTKEADEKVFAEILDMTAEGQIDQDIAKLAEKHLIEKGELDPAAAAESGKLLQLLLTDKKYSEALSQLDNLSAGRKKEILRSLCLPVLNGHLTAEDITRLIPNGVKILTAAEMAHAKAANGCDGVAFFDKGQIVLTEEAMKTGKAKQPDGTEVILDPNYFEHLMCHEMGHAVVDGNILKGETKESLNEQMSGKEPKFSSEMLKMTREILDQAEAIKDTQPAFIRFYLDRLKFVDSDFGQLNPAQQKSMGGLEGYRNVRRYRVANEIIGDYAGLYMKSDGSFDDFVDKSLDMADKDGLANFLITNLKEQGADAGTAAHIAKTKIKELSAAMKAGTETMDSIRAKSPEMATLLGSYQAFYGELSTKFKTATKGQAKAAEKDKSLFDLDESDMDFLGGGGGNYEPGLSSPSSTAKGEEKGSGSIANEFGALIKAISEETFGPLAK